MRAYNTQTQVNQASANVFDARNDEAQMKAKSSRYRNY